MFLRLLMWGCWDAREHLNVDYFETSDTVLPRRFNDFNPPQCTRLHQPDALSPLLPILSKMSVCVTDGSHLI